MRSSLLLVVSAWLATASTGHAQLSYGGTPPSFTTVLTKPLATVTMPQIDARVLMIQDMNAPKNTPYRFGETIEVDLDIDEVGVWETLADGSRLWRLQIVSRDAYSLNLVFSEYRLPDGGELYAYSRDGATVLGQFNALNNKENGQFATGLVGGDTTIVEYLEPAWAEFHADLRVGQVVHAYQDVTIWLNSPQFLGNCEVDVNCPAGNGWDDQIRAVARILSSGFLCTGSLLNNTNNDGTQLFITANHCGGLNNAIFYFNYERPNCGSGSPPIQTVQGSVQLATDAGIDYRLVRITESIPASYGVHYAGWNRSGTTPPNSVTIHHPGGEPKKISFDNNAPGKSGTDWRIFQWDLGVTEPGSSGCPLYDDNGRFIGQLWGGSAACGFPFDDFYGRLQSEWNQVAAHLDPIGAGATFIDGFDPNACPSPSLYGFGEVGSTGQLAQMGWTGTPSVGSSFSVTGTGFKPSEFAVLFSGQSIGNNVTSWGTIQVGPPGFMRDYTSTTASGTTALAIPVAAPMVGQTLYYQFAARDPGVGGNVQHSNGLQVTFCP